MAALVLEAASLDETAGHVGILERGHADPASWAAPTPPPCADRRTVDSCSAAPWGRTSPARRSRRIRGRVARREDPCAPDPDDYREASIRPRRCESRETGRGLERSPSSPPPRSLPAK